MSLTAVQRGHLGSLRSDLRFHLEQAEVTLSKQAWLGELGINTLMLFAGLDEACEKVHEALKADLPLDYTAGVTERLEMARLISHQCLGGSPLAPGSQ